MFCVLFCTQSACRVPKQNTWNIYHKQMNNRVSTIIYIWDNLPSSPPRCERRLKLMPCIVQKDLKWNRTRIVTKGTLGIRWKGEMARSKGSSQHRFDGLYFFSHLATKTRASVLLYRLWCILQIATNIGWSRQRGSCCIGGVEILIKPATTLQRLNAPSVLHLMA